MSIRWLLAAVHLLGLGIGHAASIGRTSLVQAGLVVLMVFLATGMARGYGSP